MASGLTVYFSGLPSPWLIATKLSCQGHSVEKCDKPWALHFGGLLSNAVRPDLRWLPIFL